MDLTFRVRGHELRSDSFLRLRLGCRHRDEEIVRGNRQARESRSRGRHLLNAFSRKQKITARRVAGAELHAAALGASEAKGVESMMCDLGFAVKPKLIIDATATEHILHRHGINKKKTQRTWRICGCKMKSNRTGWKSVRVESGGQFCRHRGLGAQQQNHQKACGIQGVC